MKLSYVIATLALVLASSGIALAGGGDKDIISYKVHALNSSGQHGTVTLTPEGTNTLVIITISGEPASASEPAHIHNGSCGPSTGAVKWPLNNVWHGTSSTVVLAPIAQVNKAGLAVNVHKSATKLSHYVACGKFTP